MTGFNEYLQEVTDKLNTLPGDSITLDKETLATCLAEIGCFADGIQRDWPDVDSSLNGVFKGLDRLREACGIDPLPYEAPEEE